MYTDELGRITFASKDLIKEIYRGNLDKINLAEVVIDDDYLKYLEFVKDNALYEWPIPNPINNDNIDIETFDEANQNEWFMPEEYKNILIESHLLSLCTTSEQRSRVELELELFKKHDMMNLLKYLLVLHLHLLY